jgi:hypothetical protein
VTFLQLIRYSRPSVFFASDIESPQPDQVQFKNYSQSLPEPTPDVQSRNISSMFHSITILTSHADSAWTAANQFDEL